MLSFTVNPSLPIPRTKHYYFQMKNLGYRFSCESHYSVLHSEAQKGTYRLCSTVFWFLEEHLRRLVCSLILSEMEVNYTQRSSHPRQRMWHSILISMCPSKNFPNMSEPDQKTRDRKIKDKKIGQGEKIFFFLLILKKTFFSLQFLY